MRISDWSSDVCSSDLSAVLSTSKSRAIGLGALGFHTYLQTHSVDFESFEAHLLNIEIFKGIRNEAERATKWMAETWGEPEWCKGRWEERRVGKGGVSTCRSRWAPYH